MIKGLGTALITPFKADKSVDYEALARLLDTQLTGFVDYIVVLGTTGEAATLTHDEKRDVRRFIVDYVNKSKIKNPYGVSRSEEKSKIPLVLGIGGNNTIVVCAELAAMRDELQENYAAILSVCPYYNKPNQEGLYQHFCAIAEASPVPVILYNVPGRTGVNMLPETVIRLHNAHPDKIVAIKEASGNLEQIKHLISLSSSSHSPLAIISGDDGIACEVMEAGGAGLISVASNAFPKDFYDIVHKKDQVKQAQYADMIRLLFAEGNPVGIKAVLAQKGLIHNHLRLPLVPASETLQTQIAESLRRL